MASVRRLAAIMFTDVAGFTPLAHRDEPGALRLLQEQERLVQPILELHNGRRVKSIGDGLLLEFSNALDAVECAVDLQRHVHERNARETPPPLELRIGIHLGDVQGIGTDILGDAVNVASRIEPLAEPGGVCISAPVLAQIKNRTAYQFEGLGQRRLKGIEEPTMIYRLVPPWKKAEHSIHPRQGPRRLAVLPFANISPDAKDEYFADGLTEEMISVLSQIRGLRVIARTSIGQYKATTKSVSQIGSELGVETILEGSVRKAGNRLRITLQLIDVPTQEHTWTETYDREMGDIFALQADVAERTAKTLLLEVAGRGIDAPRPPPTRNLDAYTSYLRGIHFLHLPHGSGIEEAAACFERALHEDPAFAPPYSALANMQIAGIGVTRSRSQVRDSARALIARALELDSASSHAHAAKGNFALQVDQDWATAEQEFRRAVELNPSDTTAHAWYGLLLMTLQRFPEAEAEYGTAVQLDPLDPFPGSGLAKAYLLKRDFEGALAAAARLLAYAPMLGHEWRAHIYWAMGRVNEARSEIGMALTDPMYASPNNRDSAFWHAYYTAKYLGSLEPARRLLQEWQAEASSGYTPLLELAALHLLVGETEAALRIIERDTEAGDRCLWFYYQLPPFESVRNSPRFASMLRELNLPLPSAHVRGADPSGPSESQAHPS